MEDEHSLSEHARRAAHAYGAAADHYRLASLSFWDRFGAATVARLPLAAGDSVLDLCCGAGASAIPAARAVGSAGRVLGIDVAEPLLELARARAARAGLANIEFRYEDATCTGLPDGYFDAVVCVFGVFFAPDMPAFAAEMWRLVRPGGVLAITTWGPGLFEPANTCFDHHPARAGGAVPPRRRPGRRGRPWPAPARPARQLLGHRARLRLPGYHRRAQPRPARAGAPAPAQPAAVAQHHHRPHRRDLRDGQTAGLAPTSHRPLPDRCETSRYPIPSGLRPTPEQHQSDLSVWRRRPRPPKEEAPRRILARAR